MDDYFVGESAPPSFHETYIDKNPISNISIFRTRSSEHSTMFTPVIIQSSESDKLKKTKYIIEASSLSPPIHKPISSIRSELYKLDNDSKNRLEIHDKSSGVSKIVSFVTRFSHWSVKNTKKSQIVPYHSVDAT